MSPALRRVMAYLTEHGSTSAGDLALNVGMPVWRARYCLNELVDLKKASVHFADGITTYRQAGTEERVRSVFEQAA